MKLKHLIAPFMIMAGFSMVHADTRSLSVGTQCTNPPYNYRTPEGDIRGFDVDIANEVGDRIGAEVTFVCLPFESLIPALLNNQFDLILASLSITEQRKEAIDFSLPYRSATGRFVAAIDNESVPFSDGIAHPEALDGAIVGVQRATTHDNLLIGEFPGVTINRYDSVESMLLDLQSGRIDYALTSPIKVATDFLSKPEGEGFHFVGDEIVSVQYLGEGVAIGLRKGNDELRDQINVALQSMFDDGTFREINLRTWDFSVMPEIWN